MPWAVDLADSESEEEALVTSRERSRSPRPVIAPAFFDAHWEPRPGTCLPGMELWVAKLWAICFQMRLACGPQLRQWRVEVACAGLCLEILIMMASCLRHSSASPQSSNIQIPLGFRLHL